MGRAQHGALASDCKKARASAMVMSVIRGERLVVSQRVKVRKIQRYQSRVFVLCPLTLVPNVVIVDESFDVHSGFLLCRPVL